jgi:regulator of sigma E protease
MGQERGNGMSEESSAPPVGDGQNPMTPANPPDLSQNNRTSKVILTILIVITAAIFIARNIETTWNILLVLLGFGAVIIIHEFGHFVVAKLSGIKVEAFSIFMPPILFGIKKIESGWRIRVLPELFKNENDENKEPKKDNDGRFGFTIGKKPGAGETEYRIGLIPFGGFVKMLGQEDVGAAKESTDPRSFANKPALVRAMVLAAGVTFNVISAVVIFMIVFMVGIKLTAPIVGGVAPCSAALEAGIKPGDKIIEIAGEDGHLDYSDIFMAAVLSGKNKEVPLKIRKEDGTIENVKLKAEQQVGAKFRDFGIERPQELIVAKLSAKSSRKLKKATGLMPGDEIKAVDGFDVNTYWRFEEIVESTFEPNIPVLAQRKGDSGQTQLIEGHIGLRFPEPMSPCRESENDLSNICGMILRLRIAGASMTLKQRLLERLGLKDKTGRLKEGDIIVGIGSIENPTYAEMRRLTNEFENKELLVTVLRNEPNVGEKRLVIPVVPRRDEDVNRVMIGLAVELDVNNPIVAKAIATPGNSETAPAIPRGAAITAVDGVEVENFFDIARELKKNAGQRVTVDWRTDPQIAGNTFVDVDSCDKVVVARAMPVQIIPFKQLERRYKADGPISAIKMGYKRTKIFIIQAYVTLPRLFSGLVSPKEMTGPVGILAFSYRIVSELPLIHYIYFLGLISVFLAVMNFLPFPPLDGGLVVLLIIEKIKGSALSMRMQEAIAYVGWGLVLALLVYVTFNDIVRLILG